MKNLFLSLLLLGACFLAASCKKDKDENPSCETVVNADGPAFLKVINHYPKTVQVYLGDFIPFGAELRTNHCEIYGLPLGSGSVEISTLDGVNQREVPVTMKSGETVTITVDANFF